jgi:hypothetical protein
MAVPAVGRLGHPIATAERWRLIAMTLRATLTAECASNALDAKYGGGITKVNGRLYRVRCPAHGGGDRNLAIADGDAALPLVQCHSRGCDRGSILRLICVAADLEPTGHAMPMAGTVARHKVDMATMDRVLSRCLPIGGTLAETYLASRGLDLPPGGGALKYLPPSAKYIWPTLVSIITDFVTGEPINLQFTYLAQDGGGKAPLPKHEQRRFLAGHRVKGGVVRLSDDADVCLRLGLSEGTESALAIQTSFRRAGRSEIVWAAVNAGNMARLPVVPGIEALVVYADKDTGGAGQKAAQELASRWAKAGRDVYIALPATGDWNEWGTA